MPSSDLMPSALLQKRSVRLSFVTQLGFGAVLLLMVGIGVTSRWSVQEVLQANRAVVHATTVRSEIREIENLLLEAETGQRGFLFTDDVVFLEPYTAAIADIDVDLTDLQTLLVDSPEQLRRIEQLERLIDQKLVYLAETIALQRSGQADAARTMVISRQGKDLMEQILLELDSILQVEDAGLLMKQEAAQRAEVIATWSVIGGTAVSVLVGLAALILIARKVIRPIQQVTNIIASSSSEIAATIAQQEQTASQLASAVAQTTSIMSELEASSQQSAEQANVAANAAVAVSDLASVGAHAVEETLDKMGVLEGKVQAIAAQITNLSEQTNQISNITGLVSELANQTNMLALNAAVEAVRAGEHGRGFAVVAGEIRKLADQSKRSAEKISGLVNDIRSAIQTTTTVTQEGTQVVEQGVTTTQGTATTFGRVADAISNVVLSSQQISLTAQQQVIATQQVVTAMAMLNQGASETATGISQTKVGTQQLNEAALNLKAVV